MTNKLFFILSTLFFSSAAFSQTAGEMLEGTVTFMTSRNVYVKFTKTDLMAIGDTLRFSSNGSLSPCLLVTQKSSTSCVCTILNECEIKKDDTVFFQSKTVQKEEEEEKEEAVSIEELLAISLAEIPVKFDSNEVKPMYQQRIRGRISAATYSSFKHNGDERHRMMYRFSIKAAIK